MGTQLISHAQRITIECEDALQITTASLLDGTMEYTNMGKQFRRDEINIRSGMLTPHN